ncbi:MAG: EF-hand domain-containing protein, partial [Coriobacteriia bacterium]|nr:EF-hand domain-containing protein [Coriobacteriia bacterium]
PACNDGDQGEPVETTAEGVSVEEVAPEPGPGRGDRPKFAKMFAEADKDGDGTLTEIEVRAAATAKFQAADKDGDGYLDKAEMLAMFSSHGAAGPGPAGRFGQLDDKGEWKVSKQDAPPRLAARFAEIDADGDGFVTREEIRAKMGPGPGGRFMGPGARMDADKDGKVSLTEFVDGHVALFNKVDVDGKGAVSLDEVASAKQMHKAGPGRGPGKGGKGGGFGKNVEKRFTELDADGDGKVTKAEAEAGHKTRFAAIDKNGNGVLEPEEIAAHREAKKAGGMGLREARILRMDLDGDGKITAAEFAQHHAGWFERVDVNGDGVVTLEELRSQRPGKRGLGPKR